MKNPLLKIWILKRTLENQRIWRFDFFFWPWGLYIILILIFFGAFVALILSLFIDKKDNNFGIFMWIFITTFLIYYLYFSILSYIKRLHDINMSGWWILIIFVPIINIIFDLIFILILIFKP